MPIGTTVLIKSIGGPIVANTTRETTIAINSIRSISFDPSIVIRGFLRGRVTNTTGSPVTLTVRVKIDATVIGLTTITVANGLNGSPINTFGLATLQPNSFTSGFTLTEDGPTVRPFASSSQAIDLITASSILCTVQWSIVSPLVSFAPDVVLFEGL